MGSSLCCLRGPDDGAPGCCFYLPWPFWDNNNNNTGSAARQRGDTRVAPDQGRVPLTGSTGLERGDPMDTFQCPPRPLPYDDPQFSHQTEQHLLVVGHDKASTQFQKCSQLGESKNADTRSTCRADNADGSSGKPCSGDPNVGGTQVNVPSDCEDDCPICLEEYAYENPEITLQCNHHFHLSCIYEWMERSHSCPVCTKVMLFKEDE